MGPFSRPITPTRAPSWTGSVVSWDRQELLRVGASQAEMKVEAQTLSHAFTLGGENLRGRRASPL